MRKEKNIEKKGEKPTTKELFSSRASKAGGFSLIVMAVVLIIVIVVNMIASALPSKFTRFDLTAQKEFSIGEESKAMLAGLKQDVTIYYVCQKGAEDTHIQFVLRDYANNSDHITLKTVDPYIEPALLAKYGAEGLDNNSAIVVCGENYKLVYNMDLVEYDYSNYYYYGGEPQISGYTTENGISNAIDFVVSNNAPVIRLLTGHGETELDTVFISYLEYANFKHETLDLLKAGTVPADTGCLAVINPRKDFSDADAKTIGDYLQNGGKLFLMTNSVNEKDFPNITALLNQNGILPAEGTVVEGDADRTGSGFIITTPGEHEIMENYAGMNLLVSNPQGFTLAEDSTAVSLIGTSDKAYVTTTPEADKKPEGAEEKAYLFGCVAETENKGTLIYFSTASFLDTACVNYSNGANLDLFVKCFSLLCGKENTFSIPSSGYAYGTLTITDSAAAVLRLAFLILLPGIFLLAGIVVVIRRKKH